MKSCELCNQPARMYCESDQASLCWDCDARVHGANFLVARHARVLLCRRCQDQTPWRAAGARLGPTFSVCDRCAGGEKMVRDEHETEDVIEENENDEEDVEEEEEEEQEEEEEEEEEEDGDNQVVPWTMTLPPPVSSSTSEDSGRMCNGGSKRMRGNAAYPTSHQENNRTCSSSHHRAAEDEVEVTSYGGGPFQRLRLGAGDGASGALHVRDRRSVRTVDFLDSGSRSPPI